MQDSDGDKSPRPNRFNFNYIKKRLKILKKYLMEFINELHANAKLSRAITIYFLALIPKVSSP